MTGNPSFDQKDQSVETQTNIYHADQVIVQPSGSAAASLVPQQIRRPPPDFTGREDEIHDVMEMFDSGATVIGVRGLGGIGKTALALILANRLKDRFPDGQLFLDMQGMSKCPLKPDDAMAHIIRSYRGIDALLPVDLNGLSGLYQSVLSGKRALILLDNAANREQVEPLLPPVGSALLVTSRNRFALPGLAEKDLAVLPLEDAKKLLLEISERIGEHAAELAELCGRLPIALRNAAYALKEMPNIGVTDYMKRLGEARKRLELVEASFSSSYDLLTPKLQRLWSLLSVFPADFDLAGAAAVWEMEQFPTEDALGELVKWSLVDYLPPTTDEGGRYKLHDLARDFADSRLEDAAREPAKLRHAGHYQKLLWAANEQVLQGNGSLEMGLMLFDSNLMNINAGQKWASENKFKSNQIAEICSNFAWTGPILNLKLHLLTYIEWLNEALVAVRETKKKDAEGAHLGNLGIAYFHLGDPHKAIEYYDGALKISREIGDWQGEVNSLGNLGNAYCHLGDPHKAIKYYDEALKISREIGDRRGEANHLGSLGNAYMNLGDSYKAVEYYDQALNISRETGDRRGEANHLGSLGDAYFRLGNPRKAIEYCDHALKISREIGDRRGEANHLGSLGNAYFSLGDPHKAIGYYDEALKISREILDRRGEGIHLFNMSISFLSLGQQEKALDLAKSAQEIFEKIESPYAEIVRKTLAGWKI
ncbi:MAG: tetratricopeptide repeat protein [Methanothrix sp.]|nr:tetratricopeptide repeat protein [Methanothrix sp.]